MKASRPSRQQGVAIVEFALVLPIVILLTLLAFEFGRAVMYYNTLARTTREAARYLSVHTPGTHIAEARNIVVYGSPAGTDAPVVPGLSAALVPDPEWASEGTNPVVGIVTVRVTGYTFAPIFVGGFGSGLGAITFNDIRSSMRSPNLGSPT